MVVRGVAVTGDSVAGGGDVGGLTTVLRFTLLVFQDLQESIQQK